MPILNSIRITNVIVTPVAFHDPPLLNAVGVHEPFALRSIIEVETDSGVTGLGESYGDIGHLERLRRVGEALHGTDVFATHQILATATSALGGESGATPTDSRAPLTPRARSFEPSARSKWPLSTFRARS